MVKEADAGPGQAVEVGGVDLLVAVSAQHEGGQLIGQQQQDTGAESSHGFLGGQGGQSQAAEKEGTSRDQHGEIQVYAVEQALRLESSGAGGATGIIVVLGE